MPAESKLLDYTLGVGSHSKKCCPHTIVGIHIQGSCNVFENGLPTIRAFVDYTVHNCPHCGVGLSIGSAQTVYSNGFKNHRLGDSITEFCGSGVTVGPCSPNVYSEG